VLDVQRAISLVRSKAASWGIHPARIGVIGFSAGGHLAITAGTQFEKRAYEAVDEVDKKSCRPDFVTAIYPGYLANKLTGLLESYITIPKRPPPMLFIHASDDTVAGPEHSLVMYQALRKAGASAEIHVYSRGEHGFGVRPKTPAGSTWPERSLEWLRSLGIIPPSRNP
jgi:acetyl esterase/lipase